MVKKIASYMQRHAMVQTGDHICVGVSGGADSVCLFLVLEELRHTMGFSLSVVHVEHGIRGEESLGDMEFVRRLSAQYGILFAGRSYPVRQIAAQQGLSVEEAGRNVRYQVFQEERSRFAEAAAKRGGTVKTAVAHHGDDNAETILFHLCRGSGIDGIAGMHPVRGAVIRPLLCVERSEIEAFLRGRGQLYRTDATNADLSYSRNRIRSRVLPELVQINQASVGHMNLLAGDMLELSGFLQQKAQEVLELYTERPGDQTVRFQLKGLKGLPPFLQKRVLLCLVLKLSGSRKDIAREHINALLNVTQGQTGKQIFLPYGIMAEKSYGTLTLVRMGPDGAQSGPKADKWKASLTGEEGEIRLLGGRISYRVFEIPKKDAEIPKNLYTKWFDYDKIKNRLYLRTREPGDYFVLDMQGHRQKFKDYLINEKVPKRRRDQIPVLADGQHILWAVGYRISAYYKITGHTKRVLEVQFMEEGT